VAVYAIGDVHGCLLELQRLLQLLRFDPARDRLLFVGDLVNRGPNSLECLRFIRSLGTRAEVVMGNHEVNLLRQMAAVDAPPVEPWQKTLTRVSDRDTLLDWISRLPLMLQDRETGFVVVHAGVHPSWSLDEAMTRAGKVMRQAGGLDRLETFYAPAAKRTVDPTEPPDPLRIAKDDQTVFTRIRLTAPDGRPVWPEEAKKAGLSDPYAPPPVGFSFQPWYQVRRWTSGERVVYGHWAAVGLALHPHSKGLDTGCVYGGRLTAIRLDHPDLPVTQVDCPNHSRTDAGGEG